MHDSCMHRGHSFVSFPAIHHLPAPRPMDAPHASDDTASLLKEHDYIGLSASLMNQRGGRSVVAVEEARSRADLNLEETDLRLGLGPLKESQKVTARTQDSHSSHVLQTKGDFMEPLPMRSSPEMPKTEWCSSDSHRDTQSASDLRNGGLDSRYAFVDGASEPRSLQNVWHGTTAKSAEGARLAVPSVTAGARMMVAPPPKNGVKRVYSEAMSDTSRPNVQESEVKSTANHQQSARFLNWASATNPTVLAPWHVGQATNLKPVGIAAPRAENPVDASVVTHESNDAPPAKGQVVGWPPIRSYRKNTLAAHPRPAGEETDSAIFVKVNMDGVTIGRKVDLNAHTCYQDLLLALEDMFRPSTNGQGPSQAAPGRESLANEGKALRLLNSSEFVLTYEDKDGDWMLVGDVPWGMFVNTVRRLRIMRGSESTGTLAPRGAEKPKCLV